MGRVVKRQRNDDGHRIINDPWHAVIEVNGDASLLCTSEYLGFGAASRDVFPTFKEGKVTCSNCARLIHVISDFEVSKKTRQPNEDE